MPGRELVAMGSDDVHIMGNGQANVPFRVQPAQKSLDRMEARSAARPAISVLELLQVDHRRARAWTGK
jgi:hypothetical protein